MKRMRCFFARLLAALVCAAVGRAGAQGLTIQSFDGTGKLSFSRVPTATVYRVEWAPTPAGPWTNFNGAAEQLDAIAQFATDSYTCSVPMVYRVVAAVTNAPPVAPSGMVLIPAGTNSGTDPDFGAYSLTVEAFYMDATEVTKAQWVAVYLWAIANGYVFDNVGSGKAGNHPVHTVSWYDCAKWCNARSQKEGRTPCYTVSSSVYKTGQSSPTCDFLAGGYRLPTVTEWEYAARGGLSSKRFPWGDMIDHTRANYYGFPLSFVYDLGYEGSDTRYSTDGYPYTSPSGAFSPNGYGLCDMAGNVWEWCNDTSGTSRPFRGGSWGDSAASSRCGHNFWSDASVALASWGFRTVCR